MVFILSYFNTLSIVVLVVIIIVEQSIALVGDVAIFTVFHGHVDLLGVLGLLHMQRRVRVVEHLVLGAGQTLDRSHCLVLGIKHLGNVRLQFLLF